MGRPGETDDLVSYCQNRLVFVRFSLYALFFPGR